MKLFLSSLLILCFLQSKAQEISLFDSQGKAVAYVADNLTIYLFVGKPVAYISNDNIYGFNGKHLGWWVKGIIRDHDGDAIGVTKAASNIYTEYEPYKGYKEYAPYKPYWSNNWSGDSFKIFLLQGITH